MFPFYRTEIQSGEHWYNSQVMKKYHIWTEGCQMNVADSQRVSAALEHLGYSSTTHSG